MSGIAPNYYTIFRAHSDAVQEHGDWVAIDNYGPECDWKILWCRWSSQTWPLKNASCPIWASISYGRILALYKHVIVRCRVHLISDKLGEIARDKNLLVIVDSGKQITTFFVYALCKRHKMAQTCAPIYSAIGRFVIRPFSRPATGTPTISRRLSRVGELSGAHAGEQSNIALWCAINARFFANPSREFCFLCVVCATAIFILWSSSQQPRATPLLSICISQLPNWP